MATLSELQRSYQTRKKQTERRTQSIRTQIQRCIEEETILALKLQNHKVNQIHKNQQNIQNKFKKQQELLAQLRNNQEVWQKMCEGLNRALMQAGDLVHYAGYVEAEVKQILGEGTVAQYLLQAEMEGREEIQVGEPPLKEEIRNEGEADQSKTAAPAVVAKKQQQPGSAN